MRRKYLPDLKHLLFAFWVFLLTLNCGVSYAQNNITGKVTSLNDGSSIIGATVMLEGSTRGTVTDIDGNFQMSVPATGTLRVSYLGYQEQAIELQSSQTNYIVELAEQTEQIEDVVVVGYGTMRKKEVTGAVARLTSDDISNFVTSDVGSALQGQIAGVNVQSSSGQPGASANIQIRGISSINGSNDPLYVVDGVPYDGDPGLSPSEIESLDVLKDAASAAIYGTRGAGGVILITTKSGKAGEMKISIDASYGIQSITSGLQLVNSTQSTYLTILNGGYDFQESPNYVWTSLWNSTNLFVNDADLTPLIVMNNQPVRNVSLNLSGGKDDLKYNFVGNYYNQDGVLVNSGYERYNFRGNAEFKKNKLTLTANMSANISEQTSPAWGIYNYIYSYGPTNTMIDPSLDTEESSGGDSNSSASTANLLSVFKETNTTSTKGFNINAAANYDIMDGLSVNTRVASGFSNSLTTQINPLFELYDSDGDLYVSTATRSSIKQDAQYSTNFSWESMLNYDKSFGKHNVKATGVYSMEQYTYQSFYAQKYDLLSNELPSLGATTSTESLIGVGSGWSQDRTTALVGMLARLQYNYDSRYMFSASIRRDGSSRFAKSNRWGLFPSLSAGWNVSDEEFWSPIKNTVSQMKVRASRGTTGNQNFTDYLSSATLTSDYGYAFWGNTGEIYNSGIIQEAYSNANVAWETTVQTNLGFDFGFLNNALTFNADFYVSNKKDMLFPLKIPPVAGTGTSGSVILNVGDMQNKGMEFAVGYRNNIDKLNYRINATVSRNVNTITAMAGTNSRIALGQISLPNVSSQYITFLEEGKEAGVFLMMPTNGLVNTDAKLQEYQKLVPSAQLGDLMYVDTNNDGKLDDYDRVDCGSGAPEVELGMNFSFDWKGFDLSMNWYASIGNEIVNGSKICTYQNNTNVDMLYQWSMDNQYSTIARWGTVSHDNASMIADIWVEDGSFLRLKNFVFGYSIPKSVLSKIGFNKVRLYLSAENMLTFTKYDGFDPEVGNDGLSTRGLDTGSYPVSRMFTGGIQIEF